VRSATAALLEPPAGVDAYVDLLATAAALESGRLEWDAKYDAVVAHYELLAEAGVQVGRLGLGPGPRVWVRRRRGRWRRWGVFQLAAASCVTLEAEGRSLPPAPPRWRRQPVPAAKILQPALRWLAGRGWDRELCWWATT
jgi:hypothetical protein